VIQSGRFGVEKVPDPPGIEARLQPVTFLAYLSIIIIIIIKLN
jgi:hypothetical protein